MLQAHNHTTCAEVADLHVLLADERLLQQHAHFKAGIGPLVAAPSTPTLAEIAALYIVHANWDAAMAIAQELPSQKEAAKIVSGVVQGLERSNGSLMQVAMPGLHMLYETQRHAEVVRVRPIVSSQSWLNLCLFPNATAATLVSWCHPIPLVIGAYTGCNARQSCTVLMQQFN